MGTTWTLSAIRSKTRLLSGRKSINSLTNSDLDDYINHIFMEDLVANLNLRELDDEFVFETTENVESYTNVPENFVVLDSAFINGDVLRVSKSHNDFFLEFPRAYTTRESAGTGDGATNPITGTLNKTPIGPSGIVFDDDTEIFTEKLDIDISNITNASPAVVTTKKDHGLVTGDKAQIQDVMPPFGFEPTEGDTKSMSEINNSVSTITKLTDTTFQMDNIDTSELSEYVSGGNVVPISIARLEGNKGGTGSLNLSDGTYSLSFNTAVATDQDVRATYEAYSTGRPDAVLLYGRKLFVRPVPDGVYRIKLLISGRPRPLQNATDSLPNNDWGKYIAYAAAIDILMDHGQDEAAQRLEGQLERLRSQIERKRIKNFDDQRAIPRF